jgi:hypothetical protein
MTRKHFEAIAALINERRESIKTETAAAAGYDEGYFSGADTMLLDMANDLANYFIGENPLFDEQRFLTACGF